MSIGHITNNDTAWKTHAEAILRSNNLEVPFVFLQDMKVE